MKYFFQFMLTALVFFYGPNLYAEPIEKKEKVKKENYTISEGNYRISEYTMRPMYTMRRITGYSTISKNDAGIMAYKEAVYAALSYLKIPYGSKVYNSVSERISSFDDNIVQFKLSKLFGVKPKGGTIDYEEIDGDHYYAADFTVDVQMLVKRFVFTIISDKLTGIDLEVAMVIRAPTYLDASCSKGEYDAIDAITEIGRQFMSDNDKTDAVAEFMIDWSYIIKMDIRSNSYRKGWGISRNKSFLEGQLIDEQLTKLHSDESYLRTSSNFGSEGGELFKMINDGKTKADEKTNLLYGMYVIDNIVCHNHHVELTTDFIAALHYHNPDNKSTLPEVTFKSFTHTAPNLAEAIESSLTDSNLYLIDRGIVSLLSSADNRISD